ncbi:MAG TPA: heme-binding protein, partial [Dactylosporangium sp.]|nr:heme-binding protein [Dactylosporangium sp.]
MVSTSRPRLGLVAGALSAAAVVGVTGLTVTANAAPGTPTTVAAANSATVDNRSLDIDAAIKAAEATLKAAEKGGHRVTVVVLDRSGTVQVQLKGDGAGPQTAES